MQKKQLKKCLDDVNKQLCNASNNKNGRITHKMAQTILDQSKEAYSWITRNIINKMYKKFLLNDQEKT